MEISNILTVNVNFSAPTLTKAGFGTILIATEAEDTVFTPRVKTYYSITEVAVDFADTTVTYAAAKAAFLQSPAPISIKVGRIEAADATFTAGLNAILSEDSDWYFIAETTRVEADQKLLMDFGQLNKKFALVSDDDKTAPLAVYGDGLSMTHAMYIYHSTSDATPATDLFAEIAWAARMGSTQPGETTWTEKNVIGVTADTLTTSEIAVLDAVNGNYFVDVASETVPYTGKMVGGEWSDVVRFSDWLKVELEFDVYTLKLTKSYQDSKIPYTSKGISMFESTLDKTMQKGVDVGGLASYAISMPDIADVSSADKLSRTLNNVNISGILAGAIIYATINVYLEA